MQGKRGGSAQGHEGSLCRGIRNAAQRQTTIAETGACERANMIIMERVSELM